MVSNVLSRVIFLSATQEGKKHDKKVADEAGYRFEPGSTLFQDTGFQGFQPPAVQVVQPKKKPPKQELTLHEKAQNRRKSQVRIRIEHVIGSVKRYRIVKDKIRNTLHSFRDQVLETCCGLHNFRLKFRPFYYTDRQPC